MTPIILKQITVFLASLSLIFNPLLSPSISYATPSHITPDNTTNTTIDTSPNNLTIVNIADPNSSGTSMNNFTDYNINNSGAIINNSDIISNTSLAGWIYANPHLASGHEASVIVEQITGSNISQILGYTEIAGSKAQLIILNPNGISCTGCGFINTNNLTLATGTNNLDLNSNINISNNGSVIISGSGLDGNSLNSTTILSKFIHIIGSIWGGNSLNIYQGSNTFNTSINQFNNVSNNNTPSNTQNIDASTLGSMYAGAITIVANDSGIGVNNSIVSSAGSITIDSYGNLTYNNITSNNDININSNHGNITQDGSIKSTGNTNISSNNLATITNGITSNNLTTSGSVNFSNASVLSNNINLNNNNVSNNNNTVNIDSSSIIMSKGNTISNTKYLNNQGYLLSLNNQTLNNLNNTNGYIESNTSTLVNNNNFALNNSNGTIQSDSSNLTINSNYQVINQNGKLNSGNNINLNINANQIYTDVSSSINTHSALNLNSSGYNITNSKGMNITANSININSNNFTNNASLYTNGNINIVTTSNIINNNNIASNQSLLLQGSNITNNNLISSTGNSVIAGLNSITNNTNSAIYSNGILGLYSDGTITNSAIIYSNNNIIVSGYNNVSTNILSNGTDIQEAYITSNGNLNINANQVNNIGKDNQTNGSSYTTSAIGPLCGFGGVGTACIDWQEVPTDLLTSTNSQIISSNSLLINGNVLNKAGDIESGSNMTINGNVTNNVTQFTISNLHQDWLYHAPDCDGCNEWQHSNYFGHNISDNLAIGLPRTYTATLSSLTPSIISSGNNLTITGNKITNDSGTATYQNNTPLGISNIGTNSGYSGSYGSSFINSSNLNSNNITNPDTNLAILTNPSLFHLNPHPPNLSINNINNIPINFTYQTESNIAYTNQGNFLSSSYFLSHLNFDPSRQIILAADPTTERMIVQQQLAQSGKTETISQENQMYINGSAWVNTNWNSSTFGSLLTKDQISNLTTDIIVPIYKEVNGKQVLVPTVYLAPSSNKQLPITGGNILANNHITITANGMLSSGNGISNTNTTGSANTINNSNNGNIINKGNISAGNNINLTAVSGNANISSNASSSGTSSGTSSNASTNGNITNEGGTLTSGNNTTLTSNNITLNSLIDSNTNSTTNQIQNVSKLNVGNNLTMNSLNNINIMGSGVTSLGSMNLLAGNNINIGATYSGSSMSVDGGNMSEGRSKAVNTIIQTGTQDATDKMIQKLQDDQTIQNLNITLANLQNEDLTLQSVQNQINDIKTQISNTKADEQALLNSIANTTGGNITISAGNNVNIIAGQDNTSSHYYHNESSFFGSSTTQKDTQTSATVSQLISGNNVNISSNNDTNILASVITGGGSGNISAGNNLNVESALNEYYSKNYHMETSMDVGALVAEIAVAVVVGAVTGGVGAALFLEATIASMAIASAETAVLMVGLQHATEGTENIQSGDANTTTTRSQTVVAPSLLFGGGLNTNAGNAKNIDNATNGSTKTSITTEHTDIHPDYGALVTRAAITGFEAGVTDVAQEGILENTPQDGMLANTHEFLQTYSKVPVFGSLLSLGTLLRQPTEPFIVPKPTDSVDGNTTTKSILIQD